MQGSRIRRVQLAAWFAVAISVGSVAAVAAVAPDAAVILALIVPLIAAAGLDAYAECEDERARPSEVLTHAASANPSEAERRSSASSLRERVLTGSMAPGYNLRDSVPPGFE